MTVRELIELDGFIGDITITVRGGDNGAIRLKEFHIGADEGEKNPHCDDKDVFKKVNINARDSGRDCYQLLINKIPADLLGLKVKSFHVWKCYRKELVNHSLEHFNIDVFEEGYVEPLIEAGNEKSKEIDGQMLLELE